jgi:hypothetical protein
LQWLNGLNVLLFAVTGIGGISFILAQANLTRCRVELTVHGDALSMVQWNLSQGNAKAMAA